jgi:hypothetical protein
MSFHLDSRATPMTLITPISRWRGFTVRLTWWITKRLLRRYHNIYPFKSLRRLAFIHFAHWSVVKRMPPGARGGRKLRHPYLIFQSNFNRGWREYVEAFALVIPAGVRGNWASVYGFPDPKPVGPFLDYVDKRFTDPSHFYCAYPQSSTRMVLSALEARAKFNAFPAEGSGPPPRFLARRKYVAGPSLLGGSRWREPTDTLSVLCPIVQHAECDLKNTLDELNKLHESPFAGVRWTHLARWSVVKPLPYKGTGKAVDPTWYLLFVSWFDGHQSSYIDALREGLGELNDRIWGHCNGYRGCADPDLYRGFLLDHAMHPGLAFAGYQERVTDVRAALELRHKLVRPVVEASELDSRELEDDFIKRLRPG